MKIHWLCLLAPSFLQAHPSLFFTPDEVSFIQKNTHSGNEIHLSSILYVDETHWAVWINGQCIRVENPKTGNFKIEKVTANTVTLTWGDPPQTCTLKPNQTARISDEVEE